ncbi:hypothetical protein POTOM_042319 [Populus tomentosa]|uniref:UDP-glucose/GDP-mannose dehydrogenase N-terminal domain-containing protein n=1 Tax=Populus tomentosa TaxID=118781 RepID=A0A8X8CGY5_POPTO|nr:hypothetical protein POTOM_042319 [Populus tomentosa]
MGGCLDFAKWKEVVRMILNGATRMDGPSTSQYQQLNQMTMQNIHTILCIGCTDIGAMTMLVMALYWPEKLFVVADDNHDVINACQYQDLPVFEPGLQMLLEQRRNANLRFSNYIGEEINEARIVFVAPDKQKKRNGEGIGGCLDFAKWKEVVRMILNGTTRMDDFGAMTMLVMASYWREKQFVVADDNHDVINACQYQDLPVFEPGLQMLLAQRRNANLRFSNYIGEEINEARIVFVAHNKQTKRNGEGMGGCLDFAKWKEVVRMILNGAFRMDNPSTSQYQLLNPMTIQNIHTILCIGCTDFGAMNMIVMASYWPEKQFVVADDNHDVINAWQYQDLPVFEPGLQMLLAQRRNANLRFSNYIGEEINEARIVFVAPDKQKKRNGEGIGGCLDFAKWKEVVRMILNGASRMDGPSTSQYQLLNPQYQDLPVFEPGLQMLLAQRRNSNLRFSNYIGEEINEARIVFVAHNKQTKRNGEGMGGCLDFAKWKEVVRMILNGATRMVGPSTSQYQQLNQMTMQNIHTILCIGCTDFGAMKLLVMVSYWPEKQFVVADDNHDVINACNYIGEEINEARIVFVAHNKQTKRNGEGMGGCLDFAKWKEVVRMILNGASRMDGPSTSQYQQLNQMTMQNIHTILCIGCTDFGAMNMLVMASYWLEKQFVVADDNHDVINACQYQDLPVFEPGLQMLLAQSRNANLRFSNYIGEEINEARIVFVAHNKQTKRNGEGMGGCLDFAKWKEVVRMILNGATRMDGPSTSQYQQLNQMTMQNIHTILCIGCTDFGAMNMLVMASYWLEKQFVMADDNHDVINAWQYQDLPVFEPGLQMLLAQRRNANLRFSNYIGEEINEARIVFVAHNKQTKRNGEGMGGCLDFAKWKEVVRMILNGATRMDGPSTSQYQQLNQMTMQNIHTILCIGCTDFGAMTMLVMASYWREKQFVVADDNHDVINACQYQDLLVFEPGLQMLLAQRRNANLRFSNYIGEEINEARIVFVAPNKQTKRNGEGMGGCLDFAKWKEVVRMILNGAIRMDGPSTSQYQQLNQMTMQNIHTILCIGCTDFGAMTMLIMALHWREKQFVVADDNHDVINACQYQDLPVFEPGLQMLLAQRMNANLRFSNYIGEEIIEARLYLSLLIYKQREMGKEWEDA